MRVKATLSLTLICVIVTFINVALLIVNLQESSSAADRNADRKDLSLSGVCTTVEKKDALMAGYQRVRKGYLTIGIPTINRPKMNYLDSTLRSLINNTSAKEKLDLLIVVFLADFDQTIKDETKKKLLLHYRRFISNGLIQIVQAPKYYYPSFDNLKHNYGDSPERVRWRSKQCIDFAFLFEYCSDLSEYYLQLEDDVLASEGFLNIIRNYVNVNNEQEDRWSSIHFSHLGFIGKLYRSSDLPQLAQFFKMFYDEQPVDYLMRFYLLLRALPAPLVYLPSLFQHIGIESSLKGKKQTLRESSFMLKRRYYGNNPPAKIIATLKAYGGGLPNQPYNRVPSYFWCKKPQKGQFLLIHFLNPVNLTRVVIVTGDLAHPNDTFNNATLQVSHYYNEKTKDCVAWKNIGTLNSRGTTYFPFQGIDSVNKKKTHCLKICVNESQRNWVIIREIAVWST